MKRLGILLVMAGLLAVLLAMATVASAAEKPPTVALKPDIVIKDMRVERISSTATADNVRISVTVLDTVPGTSTGPFKIRVEWTEDPTVGFTLLGTAGVANLANDPSLMVVKSETRTFDHAVPKGKAYKYRATVDFMNQVDEANESNNVANAGYVAR
jgi:hypothetical protein